MTKTQDSVKLTWTVLLCQPLKCHCLDSLLGSAESHGAKTANEKKKG